MKAEEKEDGGWTHKCDFCDKTNIETRIMISRDTGASICNECIIVCLEVCINRNTTVVQYDFRKQ